MVMMANDGGPWHQSAWLAKVALPTPSSAMRETSACSTRVSCTSCLQASRGDWKGRICSPEPSAYSQDQRPL